MSQVLEWQTEKEIPASCIEDGRGPGAFSQKRGGTIQASDSQSTQAMTPKNRHQTPTPVTSDGFPSPRVPQGSRRDWHAVDVRKC